MRRPLIAGNWKMHKTIPEAVALAMDLKREVADVSGRDILIAPAFVALSAVAEKLKSSPIAVAGQTLHPAAEGAHTGEISGPMLKSAGCSAVIVGHSERRAGGETDADVNERVRAALSHGLAPILCVGEQLADREANRTFDVIDAQLTAGLKGVNNEAASGVVIAYEPVWAIGTGKTASPEQAQEVHAFIRSKLEAQYRRYVPANVRILYGGSVKPGNVDSLMAQPDIDGALVGGASLKVADFVRIIRFQQ